MAADNQHGFGRMDWVNGEEVVSDDLIAIGKVASRNLQMVLRALFGDGARGATDGVIDGLVTSPGGGLSVNVGIGLGARLDAVNPAVPTATESDYRVIALSAPVNLAVGPNASGNPRIDIVQIRDATVVAETRNVNTQTPGGAVVPVNADKREEPDADPLAGDIVVKAGTPAGSPVPPTVDAGFVKLSEILVANGAVVINASDITDTRKLLRLSPRLAGQPFAIGIFHRPGAGTAPGDFAVLNILNLQAAGTPRDGVGQYRAAFIGAPTDKKYTVRCTPLNLGIPFDASLTLSATGEFRFVFFNTSTGLAVELATDTLSDGSAQGILLEVLLLNPRA